MAICFAQIASAQLTKIISEQTSSVVCLNFVSALSLRAETNLSACKNIRAPVIRACLCLGRNLISGIGVRGESPMVRVWCYPFLTVAA